LQAVGVFFFAEETAPVAVGVEEGVEHLFGELGERVLVSYCGVVAPIPRLRYDNSNNIESEYIGVL
jgi:hypothetical protein